MRSARSSGPSCTSASFASPEVARSPRSRSAPSKAGDEGRSRSSPERLVGAVRAGWRRDPFVCASPFPAGFLDEGRILSLLKRAAALFRAGDRRVAARFFVEHPSADAGAGAGFLHTQLVRPHNHLPAPDDASCASYASRVARALDGRRFGLVLNDAQAYDPELWARLRDVLAALYPITSYPLGSVQATIFLGDYRATPFGVHRDDSHVFTFVVRGRKRMLVWPEAAFAERAEVASAAGEGSARVYFRGRGEYRRAVRGARVLAAGPGEVMYWPSTFWHQAAPTRGLALTLALSFRFAQPVFLGVVHPMAARYRGDVALPSGELPLRGAGGAARIPPTVARLVSELGGRKQAERLRDLALHAWLRLATSGGFHRGPLPREPSAAAVAGAVRVVAAVTWLPTSRRRAVVAANGHLREVDRRPSIARLLARLRVGRVVAMAELLPRGATERDRLAVSELIRMLESWYALDVVGEGGPGR